MSTTAHPDGIESIESIDATMSWAAGTLKVLVDQVATGDTGAELTATALHLATQVTTLRRAQVLLLMVAHGLDDLRSAVDLTVKAGQPVRVLDLAHGYLEHHEGAALADMAFDQSAS